MVLNLLMRSLSPARLSGHIGPLSLLAPTTVLPLQHHMDPLVNYTQARGAARKGKRIARNLANRALASKRRLAAAQNPKQKKELKTRVKVDHKQFRFLSERQLDLSLPPLPSDDVYFMDKFKRNRFSFDEIIQFHRQTAHPDIFNQPDALLTATIELNLKMKVKIRRKRHVDNIASTVCYPHLFNYALKPRHILALCKDEEDQRKARDAGAIIVGALDIAQQLRKGQLSHRDFDHLVCHTDFLVEFSEVKTMKGQPFFPNKARGNFGTDMANLVHFFKNGVDYQLRKGEESPDYGFIDCYFGRLDMTNDQLRENLICFFKSVNRFKPLNLIDGKQFFENVTISSAASDELFMLKFWEIFEEYQDPRVVAVEQDLELKADKA